nr:glycoside hydrolase family 9 protein [Micromonospora sp. DSM 115978]
MGTADRLDGRTPLKLNARSGTASSSRSYPCGAPSPALHRPVVVETLRCQPGDNAASQRRPRRSRAGRAGPTAGTGEPGGLPAGCSEVRGLGDRDSGYADRLLTAARTAYRAAQAYPDLVAPDDEGRHGGGPYDDARLADEFYWAGVGLWLATGEEEYRADLHASGEHTADVFDPGGFDFNAVAAPARLDLATGTHRLPDHDRVVGGVLDAAERLLDLQRHQPWGQPYAPAEGWAWGSNGRILNNLVVLATAHELTGDRRWRDAIAGGRTISSGATRSASATSPATARIPADTCGPASSATISTRAFPRPHRAPWPAAPTPPTPPDSPPIPG